jgi:hypothetical protein
VFLRKLRAKVADEPTGFVWVEDGKLAGSGYPASKSQVEWLAKAGVKSILSLTEQPLPASWVNAFGITLGHVAMADHEPPKVDAMGRGVDFIQAELSKGRPVLVHCLAGEGRTGCVLAAYLIRTRNLGAEDVLAALRRTKSEFVERAQEKSVYEFDRAERL